MTVKPKALDGGLVKTKATIAVATSEPEAEVQAAPAAKVYQLGEPLNFRVKEEFKRRFKSTAAQHGLKMNELLVEAFELWLQQKRIEK